MRLFKFRGWHAVQKKMFSAEEMGADQLTLSVDGRGFVNVSGASQEVSVFYPKDKFIPMQFTGLLDKNGKEIYEGDILVFAIPVSPSLPPQGYKAAVSMNYGAWGFYPINHDDEIWRSFWRDEERACWDGNFFEVIGNIHENPELLK